MAASAKARSPAGKGKRARRARRRSSDEEDGDASRAAEIEDFYLDQAQQQRPKPVRYESAAWDISALRETWPSLPVGTAARASSVVWEKLLWMSGRYPNGYEPPQALAERLFQGGRVLFSSEREKGQVLREVRKLAQERADKLAQRKGDVVEPEEVVFQPASAEERGVLIRDLVQGKYPVLQPPQASDSPVIRDVLRNLDNNATYRTAGKDSQFMHKLESLLAPSPRSRRAWLFDFLFFFFFFWTV
jgi:hypothetical protein